MRAPQLLVGYVLARDEARVHEGGRAQRRQRGRHKRRRDRDDRPGVVPAQVRRYKPEKDACATTDRLFLSKHAN